jgi:CRP/FNR family cyclic AMP-dependent transcriptional regulator
MGEAAEDLSMELIGEGDSFKFELCDMIESAQMFSDFPRTDTEVIASYARAYSVQKGSTIFKEGGKGSFMCLVVDGRIDVFKESDDGTTNRRITAIRPGKMMGEMALLDELPHSATTIAVEDTTLVLITKFHFDRLNEEHPALGNRILRKIAKLLSLRLRQTTGILSDYLE